MFFNKFKHKKDDKLLIEIPNISEKLYNGLKNLDRLSGNEFEEFLCAFFEYADYSIKYKSEKNQPDEGIDIILLKNKKEIAVQAKAWKLGGKYTVSVKEVRDFLGAMDTKGITEGLVITTNCFSGSARDLANKNPKVTLIDRESLYYLIAQKHPMLLAKVYYEKLFDNKHIHRCPKCHSVLSQKQKYGKKFWACSNYPNCTYTYKQE